jgi:hypothetical protein
MKVYDTTLRRDIKYTSGQPMGLGPSFFLATLTHVTLLDNISNRIYGRPRTDLYRIVGDDVIITDFKIAKAYYTIMKELEVPINMDKSILSKRYGEFCGAFFDRRSMMPMFKPKDFRVNFSQASKSTAYYGRKWLERLSQSPDVPTKVRETAEKSKMIINLFGGPEKVTSMKSLLELIRERVKGGQFKSARPQDEQFYDQMYTVIEAVREHNMLVACRQVNAMLSKPDVGHPEEFNLRDLISRLQDEFSYKENTILLDFIKDGILDTKWSLFKTEDQLTLAYYMHEYIDVAELVIELLDEQAEVETFIARDDESNTPYAYSDGCEVKLSKTDNPTATTYQDHDIIPIKDIG